MERVGGYFGRRLGVAQDLVGYCQNPIEPPLEQLAEGEVLAPSRRLYELSVRPPS